MEKTITRIAGDTPKREWVRRAAAYVRVSTLAEKQQYSFAAQYAYWKERLSSDPKLEFVGVYADEGISGKNLKRRKAFLEMVEHAKAGQIEIIFVKSVTRFGRNLMDVMTTVRELRDDYGVIVYFEEEDLYSDEPKADSYLALKAMVAEQELHDMAEQQKWAIRQKFQKGILNNNGRFYGFALADDGTGYKKLVPVFAEAEVVRLIFTLYLKDGYSIETVAEELTRRGIPTATGKSRIWRNNTVNQILRNEKYTGDALLQKVYHESFTRKKNDAAAPAVPMVYVENAHEAIVDKETWNKVQEILTKNRKKLPKHRVKKYSNGYSK